MTLVGGYNCSNCGVFVQWNAVHTCFVPLRVETATGPLPTYSAGPRKYRIRGEIRNAVSSWVVDLVAEPQ